MFQYSVHSILSSKHKSVYLQYLGDGDTSSLKEVVEINPYSEFGIIPEKCFTEKSKVECVGHVTKGIRLGTRLQNTAKEYKGTEHLCEEGNENSQKKVINSV